MLLVGILEWWYSTGLKRQIKLFGSRVESVIDMFSLRSLVKTWLAPYKQISASLGQSDNSFAVQMRHMFDNLISRMVGAVVRTFMILFGVVAVSLLFLGNIVFLSLWLAMPFLPAVSLVLMFAGVKV